LLASVLYFNIWFADSIAARDSLFESNGRISLAIPAWWTTNLVHFSAAQKHQAGSPFSSKGWKHE